MQKKIIAVDFDGTLVENRYPQIGATREEVLDYCKNEQKGGARIILWTNRADRYLDDAVKWCSKHGLHLDAVNDNLPEIINAFGGNSRKIFAHEYIDDRMSTQFVFPKVEADISSSAKDWACNEVALAISKTRETQTDKESAEYLSECYKSALRAYDILVSVGHSIDNIYVVKGILNRLIDRRCLSPIDDTPDIWEEVAPAKAGITTYQCKRMSSLFKDADSAGNVTYSDVDRALAINIDNPALSFHSGFITRLIDKLFPVKMPYFPENNKFKVYREVFHTDKKDHEYDTMAILYIVTPDGKKTDIYRYFKYDPNNGFIPISKEEYEDRKARQIK